MNLVRPPGLLKAPPDVRTKDPEIWARFVDFKFVTHRLRVDFHARRAEVTSTIRFAMGDSGLPIFDWVNPMRAISSAQLDGKDITDKLHPLDLPGVLLGVKCIGIVVPPGEHELVLSGSMPHLSFQGDGDSAHLDLNAHADDRIDGRYLEYVLPSNFPFDSFKLRVELDVMGLAGPLAVFANGSVSRSGNSAVVEFPDWFTTCCPRLHIGSERAFVATAGSWRGHQVTTYGTGATTTAELAAFQVDVIESLERQAEWWQADTPEGPILVQKAGGSGGMEFASALKADVGNLDHEVSHLYFARSVLPANGNASWIDEAIAVGIEQTIKFGLPGPLDPSPAAPPEPKNIANRSPYARNEANAAGEHGWRFLAHLDRKMGGTNGASRLPALLREYYQHHRQQVVTTQDFQTIAESHFGQSLAQDFETYIYSGGMT